MKDETNRDERIDNLIKIRETEIITISDFYPTERLEFTEKQKELFSLLRSEFSRIEKRLTEEKDKFQKDKNYRKGNINFNYADDFGRAITYGTHSLIKIDFGCVDIKLHFRDTLAGKKLFDATEFNVNKSPEFITGITLPHNSTDELIIDTLFFKIILEKSATDLLRAIKRIK